jgi:hypothetical protein
VSFVGCIGTGVVEPTLESSTCTEYNDDISYSEYNVLLLTRVRTWYLVLE